MTMKPNRLMIGCVMMLIGSALQYLIGNATAVYPLFAGACVLGWLAWSSQT